MASKDRVPSKTLKGFRDIGPEAAIIRKKMIDQIFNHAIQAGFEPIETPILEYSETLLGTGNQETDKEVYLFEDHGNRRVGLRFDLTVPFSRYVADNLGTMVMPFKRVQIGNSYRGEKPQKGRYREFCQADFDIVGVDSLAADVEVISNLADNLSALIPVSFTIQIGHRIILSALIRAFLPNIDPAGENKALIALDKLAKIGKEKVCDLLLLIANAEEEGSKNLIDMVTSKNESGDTDMNKVQKVLEHDPEASVEISRLLATIKTIRTLVKQENCHFKLDLSIARGLGYYTGIVFESTIDELPGFGSVSSGGRYNGLVSRFSSQEIPGIGGSIGVDRLLAARNELLKEEQVKRKGVFIAVATEDARTYGFSIARFLRKNNILADIALKEGKLAQQFKYADRKNFAKVIIVGEDELKNQTLTIKDLATGDELKNVPLNDLISHSSYC